MKERTKHIQYGTESFGRLRTVMLHASESSLRLITEQNRAYFLFDQVPDVDRFLEEHQSYRRLLEANGVKVYMLSDLVARNRDLLNQLPNLSYLHDLAAVSSHGAIVSKMSSMGRLHEELVVREALDSLNIRILYEPAAGDRFEGCLLISPDTIFVADTERHDRASIERFIAQILRDFDQVIFARIPKERRFMHADMILNRMTENLIVFYPPAFLETVLFTKKRPDAHRPSSMDEGAQDQPLPIVG
jgi:arginine deiminase